MLWQAMTAVRDLGRLHDIASILIRYGFGDLVRRMGLANALERVGRALHWNEAEELAHLEPPTRVRRALEKLGPTFVKLGQVLATDKDKPTDDASAEAAPEPPPALPIIVIPRVHGQWTGERVCVQEFIAGISGCKLAAVDQAGLDRKVLARRGAHAVLKMIVEDGFFHADPHPGNVFYLPGNRIAFIDFGMVGRLTEVRRDQLTGLLLGLVKHEPRRVANVMLDWTGDGSIDEDGLLVEIQTFVQQYRGVALKQLRLGAMLSDLVAILRQHQLALPSDLSLLIKAFISLEGIATERADEVLQDRGARRIRALLTELVDGYGRIGAWRMRRQEIEAYFKRFQVFEAAVGREFPARHGRAAPAFTRYGIRRLRRRVGGRHRPTGQGPDKGASQ